MLHQYSMLLGENVKNNTRYGAISTEAKDVAIGKKREIMSDVCPVFFLRNVNAPFLSVLTIFFLCHSMLLH